MTSADIRRLVDEHLHDPGSGWSMGTIGAIAEFVRDPDEPASLTDTTDTTVVTTRGGIRLVLTDSVRAVAYETPAGPHDHWNHAVARTAAACCSISAWPPPRSTSACAPPTTA